MLTLTRSYYNVADNLLRQDEIILVRKTDPIVAGAVDVTYERVVNTTLYNGPFARTVSYILVSGNYDVIESSSGNYLEAEWYTPPTRIGMGDLSNVGDTV